MSTEQPESPRSFWVAFGAAWAGVFSILVAVEVAMAAERWREILWVSTLGVVPMVFAAWVVALNRRRLLRPDWSTRKTTGVHGTIALVFGAVLSVMLMAVSQVTGLQSAQTEGMSTWIRFLVGVANGVFIYLVVVASMMWSESIRRARASETAVAQAAALRAEAEAKAVRAQFNPHFVFNTLHSLMLLVRADPAAAERAIEDVATLIRYASIVQRRDLDVVPVSKECEVARRYVGLEQLRLGDRLRMEWDIEPDVGELVIPAFALQTLVENAVKHGIEPSEVGGTIRIALRRAGEDLEVVVEDNGMGCDATRVLKAGHGLELLQRRLATGSTDGASLEWETRPGEGFRVTARIPAEVAATLPDFAVIPDRPERNFAEEPDGVAGVR